MYMLALGHSNTDQFIISGHIDTVPIGQIMIGHMNHILVK